MSLIIKIDKNFENYNIETQKVYVTNLIQNEIVSAIAIKTYITQSEVYHHIIYVYYRRIGIPYKIFNLSRNVKSKKRTA